MLLLRTSRKLQWEGIMEKLLGVVLALALSACATTSFATKATTTDARLANQHLYIYSMLDLRANQFGGSMVADVNQRLRARLAERGVTTELVTYADTLDGKAPAQFESVQVPLAQIVIAHEPQEQAFGATYRLIVMPTSMRIGGAGQSYDVNWVLMEISSSRVVWSTTLQGSRTIWWSQSEDANGRATAFVDGVIAQMESSGLFGAAPAAPTAPSPTT
jgi:hypothetical protein